MARPRENPPAELKIVRIRTTKPTSISPNTTIPMHDGERLTLTPLKHGVLIEGGRHIILVPWQSILEIQYG